MTSKIEIQNNLDLLIKLEEQAFLHIIRERFGLIIHSHQMTDLYKTIKKGCEKFEMSPHAYLEMLKTCDASSPLFEHFIAGITIGETYFFRDKNQMRLIENVVLPTLIRKKRDDKNLSLRIWSAGCASGEEIYSLAMVLSEKLIDLSAWNLHLLGTDINTISLKKAINGHYSEWSMRSISEDYKKRYFTKKDHTYILSKKIRDMVNFTYLNLTDNSASLLCKDTEAQDLILCRNVLIYFDNLMITQLMQRFAKSLNQDGYLLLGASDPIMVEGTDLLYQYQEGSMFTHGIKPEKKVAVLKTLPIKEYPLPTVPNKEINIPIPEKKIVPPIKEPHHFIKDIQSLLKEHAWEKVLEVINKYEKLHKKTAFILGAQGTALANLGKLKEAVYFCEESIALEPHNTHIYFTLAMALSELNENKKSETALRQAIFIDHQYVIGHYQLGLLLLRNKNIAGGLKSLRNALNIAKSKDPKTEVPYFAGLFYGHLKEILSREIEIHERKQGT